MKKNYRLKQLILLFGDLFCFFSAFYLALSLRYFKLANKEEILHLLGIFLILFIVWIFVNYTNELYKINKIREKSNNFDLILSTVFSFLISITFFYLLPLSVAPKTILLLNIIIAYSLLFFWRLIFKKKLIKSFNQKIIFVYKDNDVLELEKIIEKNPELGFSIFKQNENDSRNLEKICNEEKIDIIIINDQEKNRDFIYKEIYNLFLDNKQIIDLSNFYEKITGRITPNVFSDGWFLENIQNTKKPFYNRLSRIIDLFFASFLGLIFLIILPFVAILIKLDSKGPIFFKQTRAGIKNKKFQIYKFRTMYALSKDGSAETDGFKFATKTDDRITKIGHFLRKNRIDELPQIVNLFKGDLTLIGPRPERPEIIKELITQMPYYNLRHIIKPGITGWAQVNQHYTDTLETSLQKIQYDLYYIKNQSLVLDIAIIFKTINVILRGKGQ